MRMEGKKAEQPLKLSTRNTYFCKQNMKKSFRPSLSRPVAVPRHASLWQVLFQPIRHFSARPLLVCCAALVLVASCRGDEEILVPETRQQALSGGTNFYLLNEGNMGSNKASLDFYEGSTGTYRHDIFPSQNPSVALKLGDVGNDIAVYGSKLYAVINASGLVEVMNAHNARHLEAIALPNCRYICFDGGKAYVSSYAGPINPHDPTSRRGIVARIDTTTLTIEATCEVGYQPEQMAIVEGKLFVANSGGYRAPDYDTSISVIDLSTFTRCASIDVAPNLHLLSYHNDRLYVSSRGNYEDVPSDIYVVNPHTLTVEERLGIEADAFAFFQNDLIVLRGGRTAKSISRYNLHTHTSRPFITDGTLDEIQMPYGIAADPATDRLYITDARDYVSPGTLLCYDTHGTRLWQVTTGDIPAHFAFVASASILPPDEPSTTIDKGIDRVFAYHPAPGQFVNLLPEYTPGDTHQDMCQKVLATIGHERTGLVTLGAAGGYLVVGFASRVPNVAGSNDLEILGNAFANASEAGIVSVMRDDNGNGLPDDTWYELIGSEESDAVPSYSLTYTRPAPSHSPVSNGEPWCIDAQYIAWQDNQGQQGYLSQNIYHTQPYYPLWETDETLHFSFTLLPNIAQLSGNTWLQPAFEWGYVDNQPNNSARCQFDIDNAVDATRSPVHLDGIDFVRIHTAVFRQMDSIGEASTEISAIRHLH